MIIHGDCLEKLKTLEDNSVDSVVTDPPYGLSFMGKKWDYDVPSEEIWRECLRVLKPGGHLLSFAGSRTYHRMAVRIEDAGFEIRDMIAWVYGSGFPKSLNIGKSIDSKLTIGSAAKNGFHKLEGKRREGRIGMYDTVKEQGFRNINPNQLGAFEHNPTTDEAKKWAGWGTALKPAHEPIVVARKPIEGTVAENCLKWGVGGINIDECRVKTSDKLQILHGSFTFSGGLGADKKGKKIEFVDSGQGRFPANFIHDGSEEVVELFPDTKSGKMKQHIDGGTFNVFAKQYPRDVETIGDSGSASRFFYCAKASKKERNMGCEELGEQERVRQDLAGEHKNTFSKNFHPTVKPIALMEYLVKLVSREGAIVLDPFTGSGSTGIACKKLNRQFIGIEREADYVKIANARINASPDKIR